MSYENKEKSFKQSKFELLNERLPNLSIHSSKILEIFSTCSDEGMENAASFGYY